MNYFTDVSISLIKSALFMFLTLSNSSAFPYSLSALPDVLALILGIFFIVRRLFRHKLRLYNVRFKKDFPIFPTYTFYIFEGLIISTKLQTLNNSINTWAGLSYVFFKCT